MSEYNCFVCKKYVPSCDVYPLQENLSRQICGADCNTRKLQNNTIDIYTKPRRCICYKCVTFIRNSDYYAKINNYLRGINGPNCYTALPRSYVGVGSLNPYAGAPSYEQNQICVKRNTFSYDNNTCDQQLQRYVQPPGSRDLRLKDDRGIKFVKRVFSIEEIPVSQESNKPAFQHVEEKPTEEKIDDAIESWKPWNTFNLLQDMINCKWLTSDSPTWSRSNFGQTFGSDGEEKIDDVDVQKEKESEICAE